MDLEDKLREQIKDNSILIYMKGTPYEPQCGFSARTVQILIECESQFSYVDVLENDDVRASLPKVSVYVRSLYHDSHGQFFTVLVTSTTLPSKSLPSYWGS